jgi:peptidoglycan/xylan/chitin deacetylase (PgdA/CDA1 family)
MFRDDDAQPWYNFNTFKNITDTLINNNISQTIGVIPNASGNSIGSDTTFKNYLNTIKNYDTVELALHGYNHSLNEFGSLSQATAEAKISSGLEIFKSDLNMVPVTFIPPYHAYNTVTVNALKNKGFTRFSTALYNDNYPWQDNLSGLLHVPAVSDFYDWDENRPRTYDEISSDCQKSLDQYDACVILFHSSNFKGSSYAVVDPVLYQTLLDVIEWTHKKESEGVKLMTIGQYGR